MFAAANNHRMAIIAYIWTGDDSVANPYDAWDARTFLTEIPPMAPDVPVQIAHLGGSGPRLDPGTGAAMMLLAEATANEEAPAQERLFRHRHQCDGTQFGDGRSVHDSAHARDRTEADPVWVCWPPNPPAAAAWAVQRQKLGLTPAELQVIADNVAPYLPRLQK